MKDANNDFMGGSFCYLFVVPWSLEHAGGVNEVVINLYKQFSLMKYLRPLVMIPSWENRKECYQLESGREIIRIRLEEFPEIGSSSLKEIILFLLRWPIALWRLYSLLTRHKVKVVNPHFPGLHLINFAVLKQLFPSKFKFVVSFHGSDIARMESSSCYSAIMKRILRRADSIIVPSNALSDRLVSIAPGTTVKIKRIYNGVDQDMFQRNIRTSPILPQELHHKPYILHVGSFEHVKGQDILLRAYKQMLETHPDIYLLLVGRSGKFLPEVERIIDEYNIANRVFIIMNAKHDKIPALMTSALFIVLPSRSESFGIVLLEAAMTKLSVIASRVGGIPELIKNRENGLLVAPEDHAQLTSAMVELATDHRLRNRLAKDLYQHVSTHFSWERTAKDYAKTVIET